jgi:nicotinate-nucleotide--dimethylbenzimidazole phosphoribosyltransferase
MRLAPVEQPGRVPVPPAELGRLGTALGWLAAAQGSWPPRPPVRRCHADVGMAGLAGGIAAADALVDGGGDLVTVEGPAAPPAALVALCVLLDIEPIAAIGTRATGHGWSELVVEVRDGLPAARAVLGDPERLAEDAVLGHATGLLAQLAVRRTPAVLGPSALLAAAALLAERIAPGARSWWLLASSPAGTAPQRAYTELGLEPLLDLGITTHGAAGLAADLLVGGIALA